MARNRQIVRNKRKNRGGERLAEWRVLKHYGLVPDKKRGDKPTLCDTADELENPIDVDHEERVMCCDEDLAVEASSQTVTSRDNVLSGRRIVDINYFMKELTDLNGHCPQFGCTLSNLSVQSELKRGLRSGFVFRCDMCNIKKTVWTEPEPKDNSVMDVNSAAVAGSMNSGGGFAALEKFMGALNIRCMSSKTFDKHHAIVSKGWEESALKEMKEAAEEEIKLAKERGDVDRNGTPLLTVVADGSWAKRSYRKNYNSLSGVAAIVGYYTRKVLYFGVKNKYCVSCVRSSNSNTNTKQDHVCFKNWNGSSSSMEAASIVEGFLASEDMYGVRYAKMIADGDSSVYNTVLEARPYDDLTVTKVECRNHLLRNYCNHLKDIATTTIRSDKPDFDRGLHLKMRRIIGSRILRCRTGVTKAISHRKAEGGTQWVKSELLRKDILNGPSHVFGEHLQCKSIGYFCQGSKEGEINYIPDMKKCGIYTKVMEVVNVLADNSKHLILDVDSNMVEHYNSSVAKFTGGKRINFTQKGSYRARCAAAVVSHNTGKAYYSLHKTMLKSSPGTYSKLYENRSKRKVCHAALRNVNKPKVRRCLKMRQEEKETKHYGPTAQKPDMDKTLFDEKVKYHMAKLKKNEEERTNLEKQTRGQSQSEVWFEERRIRLTSSNFGLICKRKPYSSCAPVIEKLLYSSINCASTQYGTIHEKTAVKELEEKIGVKVKECGLIVDEEMPFLGATPDGLIDDDGIVEIKCPSSAELLTPHEVIERKVGVVGDMWKKTQENVFVVKRSHTYHFQVQGQLHITNRKYCLFCIWTPKGLSVHKILRDDDFWDKEMKNKLQRFYMKCVLPEIIDPRRRRSMAIREPDYILEAQEKRKGSSVTTTCK